MSTTPILKKLRSWITSPTNTPAVKPPATPAVAPAAVAPPAVLMRAVFHDEDGRITRWAECYSDNVGQLALRSGETGLVDVTAVKNVGPHEHVNNYKIVSGAQVFVAKNWPRRLPPVSKPAS